jgi:hypothetical protein
MPDKNLIEVKTEILIDLYFGKVAPYKSEEPINDLGAQITSIPNYSRKNHDHQNSVRAILAKQIKWLPSVSFNHQDYHNWMRNLKRAHGEVQLIKPYKPAS